MPEQRFTIIADAYALTTTGKTACNVIAASNNPFSVIEIGGSVASTSGYCFIELFESTQATTGTTTSTGAKQLGGYTSGSDGTPTSTYGRKYSAEPTVLTVLKSWRFPNPGPFAIQFPLGREPWSLLSGSTNHKAIGIRVSVDTGTPNGDFYLEWAE